jgi:hypothetical protein
MSVKRGQFGHTFVKAQVMFKELENPIASIHRLPLEPNSPTPTPLGLALQTRRMNEFYSNKSTFLLRIFMLQPVAGLSLSSQPNQICVSHFVQARKASTREAEIATGERRLVEQVPSTAVGHGPAKWWAATGHLLGMLMR